MFALRLKQCKIASVMFATSNITEPSHVVF